MDQEYAKINKGMYLQQYKRPRSSWIICVQLVLSCYSFNLIIQQTKTQLWFKQPRSCDANIKNDTCLLIFSSKGVEHLQWSLYLHYQLKESCYLPAAKKRREKKHFSYQLTQTKHTYTCISAELFQDMHYS